MTCDRDPGRPPYASLASIQAVTARTAWSRGSRFSPRWIRSIWRPISHFRLAIHRRGSGDRQWRHHPFPAGRSKFAASCEVCYRNTHGRHAGDPRRPAESDRAVRQGERRWPYHIFRLAKLRACYRSATGLNRLRPRHCSRRSASKSCGSFFRLAKECLCMRSMDR